MTFEYFLAIIAGFALVFNEGRGQAFNNFEHVNSENLRFGIIDHDNKLSDHPGEVKNTNIVQFLEAFSNPEHIVFRGSNAGFEPSFRGAFGSNTYDENLNRNDEEALTDDDYFIRSEGEPSRPNFVYPNTDQAYGNADFELSSYDEGSMLDDPVFSELHLYDDVQPREILYASELSTSKNGMDQREKKVTPSNLDPTTDNVPVLCRPAIEVREPLSLAPSNVFCTKNGNPKTQITRTIGNFNSFDTNFATRIPVVSVLNEMENFPSENGPLPTTVSQLGKSTVLKEFVFPESVEKIVEVSRLVTTKKSEGEFLLVPTPGDFKLVNANFHANAGETVHLDTEPNRSSTSEIKRGRKAPAFNQEEDIFKPPLQEDYSVSLDEDEIKTCSKGLEPSNERYSELGGVNDLAKLDCDNSKITEMPLPLMLHKVDFVFNTLEAILRNIFGRRRLDLDKQSEFDIAKKCWLELLEEKLLKKRTKHRPDIMDTVGNFLSVSRLNRCYASVVGLLRSQPHANKYADYMKFLDSASSFISFTNKVENVLAKAVINEQKIYKFEPHQMNGVRRVKSGLTSSNAWQAKHMLPVALVALKSGDLASAFLWLSYIDQVYPLQQDDKYKNLLEHIIHQHDHALLHGDVQNTFTVPLMSQRLQVRQHLRDSHYNALCRGHGNQAAEENNFRVCRYLSVRPHFLLAPLKMEILNANPRIVLYHDIATAGDFLSGTESAVKVRSRYAGKLVNQKMCNASNCILSGYIRDQMPRISLAVASRLAAISNGRLKINDFEFELISPGFNRTLPSIANGTILQCQNSTTYGKNGDDVSFWTIFVSTSKFERPSTQLLIEPTSLDSGAGDHLPPKDAVKTETSTANSRLGSSIVDVNKFYMLASDTERSTTTQIKNNDLGGSITTRLVLDSVSGHINTPAKVSLLNPTPVFLHGRAVESHFQTTPIPPSLGSTSVPSTSTQRTGSKSKDNFMPLSPVTERNKFSTVTVLESRNVSNENESSSNLLDEGTMSVSNQNRSIPDSFREQTLSRMGEKTVSANNHKQSTLDSFREQSSSRMNEETASEDNHKQRILDRFPVYDHNGNDGTTAKGENSVEQDVKESTDYTQVLKGNYDIKVSFDAFDSATSINDLYFRISVRDGGNIMVSVAEDLCEEMSARDDDHDEQKHQATANIATKTCYEDVKRSNRFHDGYMNGHLLQKEAGFNIKRKLMMAQIISEVGSNMKKEMVMALMTSETGSNLKR
ncbi:uncharacterized protein LOC108679206 [Hyalella azteca]|uniref:Uncharacterized protein LOC108679206 n=1 Tax=Hyalella azteca TaxID=294128 RepID=A0A8B7PBB9_HYAAZ|nr:uncharacterized protein LOC108679206 [Hyalella azteca]